MSQILQQELDAVKYPDNYRYDIETLQPKEYLVNRVQRLKLFAPELFEKCNSFLDIGSSLGYFLCYHARSGSSKVTGIDKDTIQNGIARKVAKEKGFSNIEIFDSTFRLFPAKQQYDTIFLGNVFHYVYKESGWDIVMKLAGICKGHCIIEAPIDSAYFSKNYNTELPNYSFENFRDKFGKYFDLVRVGDSYCPERKIMVFKRKNNTYANSINIRSLDFTLLDKKKKNDKTIYIDYNRLLKYKIFDEPYNGFTIPSYIISLSSAVTDFKFHIVDDRGKRIGYCTEYFPGDIPKNDIPLLNVFLDLEIEAVNCGCITWDFGLINFSEQGKRIKYYDLDGICWIKETDNANFLRSINTFIRATFESPSSILPDKLNNKTYTENLIKNLADVGFLRSIKQ